jgi:hypothetical protein
MKAICSLLLLSGSFIPIALVSQGFVNMAPQWGISHTYEGVDGGGATVYDWNNDGLDDIVLVSNGSPCRFYQNTGNGFVLIPPLVSTNYHIKQLTFVDFDNDGDPDIFITCYLQPFRLFENVGNLQFVDISFQAGFPATTLRNFGHSWVDYNRDGFLDVYITTYAVLQDGKNMLFRNNGNGTFTNVAGSLGVDDGFGFSLQSVFADFNKDGLPDLFIANDKATPNSLYIQISGGAFLDYSAQSGVNEVFDAMSAAVGDYDNNGFDDIYVTNNPTGNRLYHNYGNFEFQNKANTAGVVSNRFGWGAQWLDIENDGLLDLFVATDAAGMGSDHRNHVYRNNPGGTFDDLFLFPMTSVNIRSFSPAIGDFNNDGYPDILLSNYTPHQSQVWMNQGGLNRFLTITLEGVVSNRDAIGAMVVLSVEGTQRVHYTKLGEGYLAQNSKKVMFGLGEAQTVDQLTIHWPSGHTDVFHNVASNQFLHVVEGSSYSSFPVVLMNSESCHNPGDVVVTGSKGGAVYWNSGEFAESIEVIESRWVSFSEEHFPGLWFVSDSMFVPFYPDYQFSVSYGSPLCHSDSSGWISIFPSASGLSIDWNTDSDEMHLSNLSASSYTFLLTDDYGCQKEQTIVLVEPSPLEVELQVTDAEGGFPGAAHVGISGGTQPYTTLWSDGQSSESFVFLQPGNHGVWVIDFNGCQNYMPFAIDNIVGLQGQFQSEPAGVFLASNPCDNCRLEARGIHGRILLEISDICGRIHNSRFIDASDISAESQTLLVELGEGLWFVRIAGINVYQTLKLIKL